MKKSRFLTKFRFSKIMQDKVIVTIEYRTYASYRMVLFPMTLSDLAKYPMT